MIINDLDGYYIVFDTKNWNTELDTLIYNTPCATDATGELWFDVGIKRYTTRQLCFQTDIWLWFDVGIKRYTTQQMMRGSPRGLWFDVGIKRYTTAALPILQQTRCGLM